MGLSLQMIFISLLVSLQFFLYDSVQIALGVGSNYMKLISMFWVLRKEGMKLYLNILGATLKYRHYQVDVDKKRCTMGSASGFCIPSVAFYIL